MKKPVIEYFKYLSSVPHGSGNCTAVGDLLLKFASERGFEAVRDNLGNVLIRKDGQGKGKNASLPVILQAHQDMVCVKKEDCDLDLKKDPIVLRVDNDILYAEGTSLGADDGMGEAMILAVLDDDENDHPPIEAVFTVDEETGMGGAAGFDMSLLKGRYLINLDSEEEGKVTCACAGGVRLDVRIPMTSADSFENREIIKIEISGLLGGHSGCDIDKNRLSAQRALVSLLKTLKTDDMEILDFNGGLFDNVICSQAYITVAFKSMTEVLELLSHSREFINLYNDNEPSIEFNGTKVSDTEVFKYGFSKDMSRTFLEIIDQIPQGVVMMMKERAGCVDTSMNLGRVYKENSELCLTFSLRSADNGRKEELLNKVTGLVKKIPGAVYSVRDPYPAWTYVEKSQLRDIICDTYKEITGKDMEIVVTHGGLECGYFASGIENSDCISIGPEITDIHSVKEKVSLSSVNRSMELLTRVLTKLSLLV